MVLTGLYEGLEDCGHVRHEFRVPFEAEEEAMMSELDGFDGMVIGAEGGDGEALHHVRISNFGVDAVDHDGRGGLLVGSR